MINSNWLTWLLFACLAVKDNFMAEISIHLETEVIDVGDMLCQGFSVYFTCFVVTIKEQTEI